MSKSPPHSTDSELEPETPPARREILLVDDNVGVLRSLERVLGRKGWTLHSATDAVQAMDVYQERAQRQHDVDLVLTDLHMPGPSGLELCAALRCLSGEVELIVSTAAPEDLREDQLAQWRVAAVISKPWDCQALIATVRSILDADRDSGSHL